LTTYQSKIDGILGPYSTAQLRQMAASGTLQPADMVLAQGAAKWHPASLVPGLFLPPSATLQTAEEPPLPPELAADYFVTVGGQQQGPFTLAQLQAQGLRPETPVWRRGTAQWVRADQLPEVNALFTGAVPSVPAPAGATGGRPWNPVAVAWLGLLLSPLWSGIMAAVNARRLGLDTPWWRPVGIGVGSLVVFLALDFWLDSYLLGLALYLGAVGLIAALDLVPQKEPYLRHSGQGHATGGWVGPSLAGVVPALLVFITFVVFPLLPLSPRQVCERFVQAKTEGEMKRYTTNNLWPALSAVERHHRDWGDFELTEEGPLPELGGYAVAWRWVKRVAGQDMRAEGIFHLVERPDGWKIEDFYVTVVNGRPLEPPAALSVNYPQMETGPVDKVAPSGSPERPGVQAAKGPKAKPKSNSLEDLFRGGRGAAVLKGLGVILAALGAGVAAVWRKVTSRENSTAPR
jgi:hypothetical protein